MYCVLVLLAQYNIMKIIMKHLMRNHLIIFFHGNMYNVASNYINYCVYYARTGLHTFFKPIFPSTSKYFNLNINEKLSKNGKCCFKNTRHASCALNLIALLKLDLSCHSLGILNRLQYTHLVVVPTPLSLKKFLFAIMVKHNY